MTSTQRNIRTIKQAAAEFPFLCEGGLRHQIFHENTNGLKEAGVILRDGRRVLVDMDRYFVWLDRKNGIQVESNTA